MTIASEGISRPQTRMGAGVVPLLALAVFINYIDRGNLATAAPLIKDAFKLSSGQLGFLLSAFFWTYTPGQILAGWLAERINAYRTLALGLAVWAFATAASGLATGFLSLVVLRLVLGVGESVAFPCSSKILAQNLPENKLGKPNAAVNLGLALGPAVGTFVGGMLLGPLGWRATFVLFGFVSLMWLGPWLWATSHLSARDTREDSGPGFRAILVRRDAWGACLGHFSSNYGFYFVISWLPTYLVKEQGFTVAQMATVAGLIYLVYALSIAVSGWLADFLMAHGATSNQVRKGAMVLSHTGVALGMLGCMFGSPTTSLICLFFAALAFGPGSASIFAVSQTLAGPRAAHQWVAIQNCAGNIAGIIGPWATGLLIERTGHFFWAFAVAGIITVAGIFAWGLIIKKVAPINWTV